MSTVALRAALAPHHLVSSRYRKIVAARTLKWVRHSGFDWTADRCKSVIQYLLKLRAGEPCVRPPWVSSTYLAYAESVAKDGGFAKFAQLLQVWRVFTLLGGKSPRPTEEQVSKFEGAVTSPIPRRDGVIVARTSDPRERIPLELATLEDAYGSVRQVLPEVHLPPVIPVPNPLSIRRVDSDGRPTLEWEELVRDSWFLPAMLVRTRLSQEEWPYALRLLAPISDRITRDYLSDDGNGPFGVVRCRIQRDGKARFFLSPSKWLQFLFGPWGRALYRALQRIPQDCTFEQEKGVRVVQKWLEEGRTVYSFDLSSATDRFPLALSRDVLWRLSPTSNLRMWVHTYCVVSRFLFGAAYSGASKSKISWEVGQPLGLLPSFAVFAMSHHALVRALWYRHGDPTSAPYVLLGDDIVIASDTLAQKYLEAIQRLGVPISEPKSLRGRIGEFAGRVIAEDGWEYKLKYFPIHYRSLLSWISLLGPRAVRSLRKTRLRDIIALLPTPRTPAGINPGGFSREEQERFLVEYFARARDESLEGELLVDPITIVRTRIRTIPFCEWWRGDTSTARAAAPIGAASVGLGGAPQDGERTSRTTWKWSPWSSRAWLRRVKSAAKAAGLL